MNKHWPNRQKTRLRWSRGVAAVTVIGSLIQVSFAALAQDTEGTSSELINRARYSYRDADTGFIFNGSTGNSVQPELVDPLGQILGCNGNLLPNYDGYSVALYEPDATGLELGNLISLTRTELPDIPGNGVFGGKTPNIENSNPFFLTNADAGRYNFLFDPTALLQSSVNAGLTQLDIGAQYILVVNTPAESGYPQRRIKIEVLASTGGVNNSIVRYRATALDGIPISVTGGNQISETVVEVLNAEVQGLDLFSLAFNMVLCESDQVEITKTADRAAAQPGDTIVYRLAIRNLADAPLAAVIITDILPAGFQLISDSVYGQINDQTVGVTVDTSGNRVTFSTPTAIPSQQVMDLIYAVRVTPDALRGDGQNTASIMAERLDNGLVVQDGPSIHRVVIDPGILSDCATLIGRVFVDKNFDGEQQPGEPGIPNAVIFLDDGNRIVTDADGLYSVQCMLPGQRSGVLDISSLPGYTLSPNLYFNERNSQSRIVQLAPGGMVRMNFAVTPTFQEETQ